MGEARKGGGKRVRCGWVPEDDPLYRDYHDREWGVPLRDDRELFEMLILEGAQAGLSWRTVLHRREGYREAFDGFDPAKIARYDARRLRALRADTRIVRNRLKIEAAVSNARAWLEVRSREGDFSELLWGFVGGRPRVNRWRTLAEVPAQTDESVAMSRELKRRGFRFVGPTICYAFMQATGMVDDHTTDCFRHGQVGRARRR